MSIFLFIAIAFGAGYAFATGRAFYWKQKHAKAMNAVRIADRYIDALEIKHGTRVRSFASLDREGPARYSDISEFAPRVVRS